MEFRISSYFATWLRELPSWIFIVLWICGNAALFGYTFWRYENLDEYYYLRYLLKSSISISRGSAAALNLNLALILLPVCRNLISTLRGSVVCCHSNLRRPLDKNIHFHKLCAYMICFWTVIHYMGHTFNFERFIYSAALNTGNESDSVEILSHDLSQLPMTDNGTWINPVRTNDTNPMYEAMTCLPGCTGIIATLILLVLVASSTEHVRRNYYEVFWFTHHFFILFFALIIVHGFSGMIREQTNLVEHDFRECEEKSSEWNEISECPAPQFAGKHPVTWMWVIVPCCLYILERTVRFLRSRQPVTILQVVKHPSNVLELQMVKSGFKMISGQYIFLNCPQVSYLQWHPFTLTSAPQDLYFSVHIRVVGDWTQALADKFQSQADITSIPQTVSVAVDGPLGTCSEDVFKHEVAILIGAGIGVTPFASILKHIWYLYVHSNKKNTPLRLTKVYFYWVSPDTQAFEWFVGLLQSLEEEMDEHGHSDFLEFHLYWTCSRGFTSTTALQIIAGQDSEMDVITSMRSKMNFGRPEWNTEFRRIAQRFHQVNIGVFFCGPKPMAQTLRDMSQRHSINGTQFVFHKENF